MTSPSTQRSHRALVSIALFAWVGPACTTAGDDPSQPTAPGYVQLHTSYFATTCAQSACHSGDQGMAGLSFADPQLAYERLVDGEPNRGAASSLGLKLVTPGDPDASYLYRKLVWASGDLESLDLGAAMPLGLPRPGPELVDSLRAWIEEGAPWEGAAVDIVDEAEPESADMYVTCDATDVDGMQACFGTPPDPAEFLRLFTPPLTIPPGSEQVFCSFLPAPTEDLVIRSSAGQQMAGGHHIAVFVGLAEPPGADPVPCSDISMGSLRFVLGAGGAGGQDINLPPGVSVTIPKGKRIVIQSHYINVNPEPRVVMDAVDLELTSLEESPIHVDPFTVMDSQFEVPAGAEHYERIKTCRVDEPMDIYMMLGHTHDYGVLFTLDIIRAEGPQAGVPQQFYYETDGPLLRDTPEMLFFEDEPIHLAVDDEIRVTCAWTNTTDEVLAWPAEMCVALMYYGPGKGFLMCDTDDDTPWVQDGGAAGEGCMAPGSPGNELGVGKACTEGGGECADTPGFTLCLAEFDPTANYCSVILCEDDTACGDGATCVFDGPGSACVPDVCIG